MKDIFDKFKEKVVRSIYKSDADIKDPQEVDNLIALGVLLWEVAEADDQFLPEEAGQIEEVLKKYDKISDADMPIVMRAIEEASIEKIELYSFTKEVGHHLKREVKMELVEQLFRVACADNTLDEVEVETIRTIANLFGLDHKEFIAAKVKVKKEFGMDTAGL